MGVQVSTPTSSRGGLEELEGLERENDTGSSGFEERAETVCSEYCSEVAVPLFIQSSVMAADSE
jgi:hypothetical protein